MENAVSRKIFEHLYKMNVPIHMKGFKYLEEAIYMVVLDEERLGCITKEVYATIAEKYGTSLSCVERDIRFAVEGAWKQTPKLDKKPTNKQYITSVLGLLKLDGIVT